jgi:Pentapeptide repeats (8 copies)
VQLREMIVIETSVTVKLQLELQIQEAEAQRKELEDKLAAIENGSSKLTVTENSDGKRKRAAFVIEGSFDNLDPTKLAKLQAMVRVIQQLTGDASMVTVDIEEGSIRLILEGSEEGIERLKQLFDEGELAEILGTPVRGVEPIASDILNTKEVREDRLKALLISTIRSPGAVGADLSGADLTNADLRGSDLSGADLTNADLRGANFTRDLELDRALELALDRARDHNYRKTNLNGANLSGANLSGVDLSDIDLSGTSLNGAIVTNTYFGAGIGLTEAEKRDLKRRGAIFDDAQEEGSSIYSPSPVSPSPVRR